MGKTKPDAQFRCNLLAFQKVVSIISPHLIFEHFSLIELTPFASIFWAFYDNEIVKIECTKSDEDIKKMLECYNPNLKSFEFKEEQLMITRDDISRIFDVQQGRDSFEIQQDEGGVQETLQEKFFNQYFKGLPRVKKTNIEAALHKVVLKRDNDSIQDTVSLLMMQLLSTLFFGNSSYSVPKKLLIRCVDIEEIDSFDWCSDIHNFLSEQLQTKSGKNTCPYGCVIALLYWFCEKSNIIPSSQKHRGISVRENTAGFLKWNLSELHSKLQKMQSVELEIVHEKINIVHEEEEEETNVNENSGNHQYDDNMGDSNIGVGQNEFESAQCEIQSLKRRLQAEEKSFQNQSISLNEALHRIETSKHHISSLHQQINVLTEEKNKTAIDNDFLKDELEIKSKLVFELEAEIKSLKKENENLKSAAANDPVPNTIISPIPISSVVTTVRKRKAKVIDTLDEERKIKKSKYPVLSDLTKRALWKNELTTKDRVKLCDFWRCVADDERQTESNKANRAKSKLNHACSSKSLAVRATEKIEKNGGYLGKFSNFFKDTRFNSKTGKWATPICYSLHAEIKNAEEARSSQPDSVPMTAEEVSTMLLRPRSGIVKGLGMRPSSLRSGGSSFQSEVVRLEQGLNDKDNIIKALTEKVDAQQEKVDRQQEQIEFMMDYIRSTGYQGPTPPPPPDDGAAGCGLAV